MTRPPARASRLQACAPQRRPPGPRSSSPAEAQATYCRGRDLPRLLALWPREIDDPSPEAHVRVVAKLRAALRAERRRGLGGHWTYDLARHRQLLVAYRAELAQLEARHPTKGRGARAD